MKRSNEWRRIVFAGLLAAVVASCGPTGMGMMGDAMVDAGDALMDAGRLMTDGGDAMTPDAQAQPGCAMNCTSGGTQRIVTADSDLGQLRGGTVQLGDGVFHELVAGPFVLTDASAEVNSRWFVSAAACNTLDPVADSGRQVLITTIAGTGGDRGFHAAHGARIPVPAGSRLCVTGEAVGAFAFWSGFVPYN